MSNESEYRKMEKILREFCGGNPMARDGEERGYSRGRIRTPTRIRNYQELRIKNMGGISRIRKAIRAVKEIFSGEEESNQDN